MIQVTQACELHNIIDCGRCQDVADSELSKHVVDLALEEDVTDIGIPQARKQTDVEKVNVQLLRAAERVVAERTQTPPPAVFDESGIKEKQRLFELASNGGIIEVPVERVKRYKGQPREFFDVGEIARLAEDLIESGQGALVKIIWLPDDPRFMAELIDGERRQLAAKAAGKDTLQCYIDPNVIDEETQFDSAVAANHNRVEHTPMELAYIVNRYRGFRWSWIRIARRIGKGEESAKNYRRLLKLHPDIQRRLNPSLPPSERVSVTVAAQLAYIPDQEEQLATAQNYIGARIVGGANKAVREIRTIAKEAGGITPKRSPSKDFLVVEGTMVIIQNRCTMVLDIPDLAELFKFRPPEDLQGVIVELDEIGLKIEKIRERFAAISSTNGAVPG